MTSRNIKPLFLMHDEGLADFEKHAVLEGIVELLKIAGVNLDVTDYGVWKNQGYVDRNGYLTDFNSIDWYLQEGLRTSCSRSQLNAEAMLDSIIREPWRRSQDHYDVIVTSQDMYAEDTNFVVGLAIQGIGTIISVNKFRELDEDIEHACVKTETMHELGHVFGIPSERRRGLKQSLGLHCTNRCIMRQGLNVPSDWIDFTNDRLENSALCNPCENELRNYFRR